MQTFEIPTYIFVQQMPDHAAVKKQLLRQLTMADSRPLNTEYESISATDWEFSHGLRNWEVAFRRYIQGKQDELAEKMLADAVMVTRIWFQQYKESDFHTWHAHNQTNYSSVYFVECAEGMETEFFDISKKEVVKNITVKEGDIITFPSSIYHRSKPNNSGSRKTIISWNLDFASQDDSKILKILEPPNPKEFYMQEGFNDGQDIQFPE